MKNSIRKNRHNTKVSSSTESSDKTLNSTLLYNLSFFSLLSEILIGAVGGVAICFGFIFAFFLVRGSLIVSFGLFIVILILAGFCILMFKYIFLSILLKKKEVEILEQIRDKS